MSSLKTSVKEAPRRRWPREKRRRQLIDVAWRLVRNKGSDALTLGNLAEHSGVSKPVVYSHFKTREALLAALYFEFDARQNAFFDASMEEGEKTLDGRAKVIAAVFVECMLAQGQEIPEVISALAGSPELAKVRRECEVIFIDKCRKLLGSFAGAAGLTAAGLWAILGAAQVLTREMSTGQFSPREAQDEIAEIIITLVKHTYG